MKVDTKEISKISDALESIDGWDVEDFKVWQTQTGKDMATIRLKKSVEKKEETKTNIHNQLFPGKVGGGGMSTTMNITGPKND